MGDQGANRVRRLAWVIGGMALLTAGCADTRGPGASSGGGSGSVARAPGDGVGHYKIGRPYQIKGKWYTPYVDYDYQETGLASWYGPGFHGRMTANGEIFDENDLTAAHTTLPLPSVVRVTNLDNGRAMIVRVNDRGPFVDGRILDVSRRTAQMLGFERDGLARVHVELLADDSKREMMIAKGELPREPGASATMLAQANPAPTPAPVAAAPAPAVLAAADPAAPARMTPVTAVSLEPPPSAPSSAPPLAVAAAPEPLAPPTRLAAAAPPPPPSIPAPAPAAARPAEVASPTPSRMASAPAPAPRFALVAPAAAATPPPTVRPSVPPPAAAPLAVAPAPLAPASGILVNTGTFSSAAAAERVRTRLAGFGPAQVIAERPGVWRVRVGPLPSPAHAERVMEATMTIAQEEARVAAR